MADYNKILEQIKCSEARVSTLSRDIKDVEAEIKTLDNKIEIIKAKEKQLREEVSYKQKMVYEKEWELQSLKKSHEIWKTMFDEKKQLLDVRKRELEAKQQKVWNTRIAFHDKTLGFLAKNDFLFNSDGLESIIKKQREKMKLIESIDSLESNINEVEKEHNEISGRYDLLVHLEKEKETLLEYEQSPDIVRLQNKIDSSTKDLEYLEFEISKYSERATLRHEITVVEKLQQNYGKKHNLPRLENSFEMNENNYDIQEGNLGQVNSFKLKVPSWLMETPGSKNDKL